MGAKQTLTAVVVYQHGKNHRCPVVTEVTVRLGGVAVATATLGGRYTQAQALAEYRRNPDRFGRPGQGAAGPPGAAPARVA
jgi:hypothetical protein